MNEFGPWMQGNWYAVGSLLTQLAFLITGVWFARNLLITMRAIQEQVGALLRLSITAAPREQQFSGVGFKQSEDTSPYSALPSAVQTASVPKPTVRGSGRLAVTWRRLVLWFREPVRPRGLAPWRGVARSFRARVHTNLADAFLRNDRRPTILKSATHPCEATTSSAVSKAAIERLDGDVALPGGYLNPDLSKLGDPVSKHSQKSKKDPRSKSEKDPLSPVYTRRWGSTTAQAVD